MNAFKNQHESQGLWPVLFEAYSAEAEKMARNAFRSRRYAAVDFLHPIACLCRRFRHDHSLKPALQFIRQLPGLIKLDISAPTQVISFNGGINLFERSMDAIASLAAARDLRLGYNRFPARLV